MGKMSFILNCLQSLKKSSNLKEKNRGSDNSKVGR